ncbi:TonB-dependent receptor [Janthinobacterium lividum]|nr:TonB-dependent receptor [Janthinobacterium lividum]
MNAATTLIAIQKYFGSNLMIFPRNRISVAVCLAMISFSARAQTTVDDGKIQVVELKGTVPSDVSTASKTVVGRQELTKYGDVLLVDTLKRVSGISFVAGELRMRGLGGGYTQILINGDPAPPGFSIANLSPDLVERVDIIRGATADLSAQGVAGTVNIILRRSVSSKQQELKLNAMKDNSGWSPNATLQVSDKSEVLSYTVTMVAKHSLTREDVHTDINVVDSQGQPLSSRQTRQVNDLSVDGVSLAPRLTWVPSSNDSFVWQSFVEALRSKYVFLADETVYIGDPSEYPDNSGGTSSRFSTLRTDVNWTHRIDGGGKLDTKIQFNHRERSSNFDFLGGGSDSGTLFRIIDSTAIDKAWTTSGKYLVPLMGAHGFAVGWDASYTQRHEGRFQSDSAPTKPIRAYLAEEYDAVVRTVAGYAQDEWNVSANWLIYLGMRWEWLNTKSDSNVLAPVQNTASVLSPVLQSVYKLPWGASDKLRVSLSRTFKPPATASLMSRRFTVNNDNGPTNPDRQGNPSLLPELTWGIDAGLEHAFAGGGQMALTAYGKKISQVVVPEIYVSNGAWVTAPVNGGKASARGFEVDVSFPLKNIIASAPALDIRANFSRNWSRLTFADGSSGRLPDQVPYTANLGFDYTRSKDLQIGANLNASGAIASRITDSLSKHLSGTRTLDVYAAWTLNPRARIRISGVNLLQRQALTENIYTYSKSTERRLEYVAGNRAIKIVYEMKL